MNPLIEQPMLYRIPIVTAVVAAVLTLGGDLAAQAAPCQAYTVERPNTPYGYEEINNCPNLSGEFSNANWRVSLQKWEPAAYLYRGFNRQTSDQIQLIDFDVVGTTDRPQYRFHNGDTTYTVSFQTADPDTIRPQVYQLDLLVVNELLYR